MGDPETEVVMPRLKSDLVALLVAAAQQKLHGVQVEQDERCATTIVAVSGGYPNEYVKGYEIIGLDDDVEDTIVFQAGTQQKDGEIVTSGGRVMCATGLGGTVEEALAKSRERIRRLYFDDIYYRRDIGFEFVSPQA
jgi:phosphoribosylamine--glycine ligase